ncbi:MAG: tetratricopeptide repeat protein [Candidatus Neomarinimicrobiota bacterium]|nr:tetratricopeptide repeat protein [Candidatus Neomarinimicrobiota bacterium]MEE3301847.1 tetratricopeptide repeat protein [Candidatus Neomarinimicrobiota bacterium]
MEDYLKKISTYYTENKRTVNMFLVSFVVGFVLVSVWNSSVDKKELEAHEQLSNSLVYLERGDFDNSELQLSIIVEDYNGTKSADHAKFYLGRIAFINNDTDKASNLLRESVKNLEYPNLKTEAYIMLARMETDSKKAMRLFDSAQKATNSQTEKNYVSILKARRMISDNNKEGALEILDAIELESNAYQEMFEHTYGMASALN